MKKVLTMLLAICMFMTVLPAAEVAAATCTEYSGHNVNAQNYDTWADTVKSHLVDCGDGILMRFQYAEDNDGYVAEYYDSSYQLLDTRAIPEELPLFGGFYAAKDGYFILTGQRNKKELVSVECYRITKYDKDWKRLGSAGLYDCNTTLPFRAGSARMTEAGDYLLIRTCHEMYTSRDGKNHQANVTIQLNKDTMQITDSFTRVMNSSYGYVSHSFNQFIRVEDGKIVAVDHGDAYPRSVALIQYPLNVLDGSFSDRGCEVTDMLEIPGEIGANYTGVSVGGFEYSGTAWLAAGNKVDFDSADRTTRNIFVAAVSKETGEVTVNQITNYSADDGSATTPHLVKTGADEFVLLWGLGDSVYYTWLDGSGRQTGEIYQMKGSLSDCVPLIYGGKIVWYTWKDSTVTFYEIDSRTPSETSRIEVQSGHTWECISVKNHTATLKCTRCGKKKTVATPDSVNIWWLEQDNTDGYYYSKFSNPFELGESIQYWLVPQFEGATAEEATDFLLEYSDPEAVEILPDSASLSGQMMGMLCFKKTGTYTLTIRHCYDTSLAKAFTFVVSGPPDTVSLDKKKITLNPKQKYSLVPTLTPKEAVTAYTWTSSDKKVAKVKDGEITAVAAGKATITVTTENGKKAVCTVTVKNAPTSIKLSKESITLQKGKTYQLKVTLTPSDAYTTYTWTSSNKKVATVSSSGKVKAVKKGKATITVTTANGKKASCTVTVK